jgi:hypothetical protein
MNCAPAFDMVRKSLSPFVSMNVTSFRSIMHFLWLSARWDSFQLLLSSLTHNPTKRPCRIHFSSAGVSVLEIFNKSTSSFAKRLVRPTTAAPCSALFAELRETISLPARFPFLTGAPAPSACGLRCHRAQKKPRPSRTSSARYHGRGRRRCFRGLWDRAPRSR